MRNEKAYRFFIFGISLLAVMGVSLVLPILPDIERQFNVNSAQAALVITAYTLPGIFITLLCGAIADMYGRKKVLIPGIFCFTVGGLLCVTAKSFEMLLLFRAVQGIGGGVMASMYAILVADSYEGSVMTKIMGQVTAVTSIGTAVFPFMSGFLGEISWKTPFWVNAFGLVLYFLFFFISFEGKVSNFKLLPYLKQNLNLFKNKRIFFLFILVFLSFMVFYGTIIYFPSLANIRFHATSSSIGILLALGSIGAAIMAFSLAWLSKKYSLMALLLFSGICYLFSQIGMLITPYFLLYIIPLFFAGIGQGLCLPIINRELVAQSPENHTLLLAINGSVFRASQTLAPFLFGLAWTNYSWKGPYFLGGATSLLFIVVFSFAFTEKKKNVVSKKEI